MCRPLAAQVANRNQFSCHQDIVPIAFAASEAISANSMVRKNNLPFPRKPLPTDLVAPPQRGQVSEWVGYIARSGGRPSRRSWSSHFGFQPVFL
jgi:hypothetical protein